nr:MAG TPA: hypothetical protein [Caudoviricetes sp.]
MLQENNTIRQYRTRRSSLKNSVSCMGLMLM